VRKPHLDQAMNRYHYVVGKVGMTGECAPTNGAGGAPTTPA